MTENGKRLWVHIGWGSVCVLLAYAALQLRVRIAADELAQSDYPDFQHWMAMRTLDAELRDQRAAHDRAVLVLKHKDFRHSRLSGQQVVATAIAAAKKEGDDMKGYGQPQIVLLERHDRLVWSVSFYQIGGPPGAFFGVAVDDETGATEISPGL